MTFAQLIWLAGCFVAAASVGIVITALVIRGASALRLFDAPDGVRRLHDSPVPRLGGVAVYASALGIGVAAILLGSNLFWPGVGMSAPESRMLVGLLVGSGLLFLVGLWDDLRGLPPSVKFGAQLIAALAAWYFGVRLDSATLGYGEGVRVGFLSLPIVLLWIIGVTNAYNFIDGLNGLAGGIAIVACAATLAVSIGIDRNYAVLMPAAALAGAMLGFLRYNFPRARIFLGDAGSMSVGFALSVLLLKASEVRGPSVLVAVPVLAMCVPLLDVALAVLRRWLRGVPLSGADARHIHHRLMALGLSPRRTVVVLWCLAAGLAAFGLLIALTAPYVATSIAITGIVGISLMVIYGTNLLSYDELIVAGEVLFTAPSRFRRVISDQLLAHDLSARIQDAAAIDEIVDLLISTAPSFGFLRMELVRESRPPLAMDEDSIAAWAWKLEYPLGPRPRDPGPAAYKLAIWCSAENSVRPYGAERAAKIIAPALDRWLHNRAGDLNTQRPELDYGRDSVRGLRRLSRWSRAR